MRCVHVFSGDLWAGAEVATVHLVQELARRPGIDIRVVALNDGQPARALRRSGVPLEVFPESRLSFAAIVTALVRFMRDCRPEIIHSHRYKENLAAAVASAACGSAHVRTAHGLPPAQAWDMRRAGAFLDAAASRLARSHWIAVSADLGQRLAGRRRDVRVIPNGLPAESPRPIRHSLLEALGAVEPVRIVGFVGRLENVKRPDRFLRIVRQLPETLEGVPVHAVIAGDGSARQSVEVMADAPELRGRVGVLGAVTDGAATVGALDVLVIPSDHEGHPMVLLEAMRAGIPVVASRVGGLPEVLGPVSWTVPPEDEAAMAAAVRRLLTAPDEREAWSGALRRAFQERYTISVTADRTLAYYGDVIGSRRGART